MVFSDQHMHKMCSDSVQRLSLKQRASDACARLDSTCRGWAGARVQGFTLGK